MAVVLFQPLSKYDNLTRVREARGLPMYLNEPQPQQQQQPPLQNTYEEPTAPPASKRLRIDPDSSVGSNQLELSMAVQNSLSVNIASGWWLHNLVVRSILPIVDAAKKLVTFYDLVAEKAGEQLQAGATELKTVSFKHGAISLVLSGTDIIYWDWIIDFALAMVDSTNAGNPAQFKSMVTSVWQQNTVLAELFLSGSRPE
ncbi:MAG: hypothetical protein L6R41_002411 [Letrouitia leprolyta]|nr:MAG: hypothetical protein L6R41_002411 [Letrouitia leprolyta]